MLLAASAFSPIAACSSARRCSSWWCAHSGLPISGSLAASAARTAARTHATAVMVSPCSCCALASASISEMSPVDAIRGASSVHSSVARSACFGSSGASLTPGSNSSEERPRKSERTSRSARASPAAAAQMR
eukprot:scaffold23292_cov31-Tisochrysis_lutea.AAC.2